VPSRPYELKRRAAAMEERRARIVAAAIEELISGRRFTLEAVAKRAGVSRVTVYAQFGDRDALLEAVYDDLAASGGLQRIPDVFATEGLVDGLEVLAAVFCHFYSAHRDVLRRLGALSVLSDDDHARHESRNARRHQIIAALLGRAGLDDQRLNDTLQALTSFAFVDELGGAERTPDDVAPEVVALVVLAVEATQQRGSRGRG
jgi:AcrR family transcriptional regulator